MLFWGAFQKELKMAMKPFGLRLWDIPCVAALGPLTPLNRGVICIIAALGGRPPSTALLLTRGRGDREVSQAPRQRGDREVSQAPRQLACLQIPAAPADRALGRGCCFVSVGAAAVRPPPATATAVAEPSAGARPLLRRRDRSPLALPSPGRCSTVFISARWPPPSFPFLHVFESLERRRSPVTPDYDRL